MIFSNCIKMLKYQDKVKLAFESMEALVRARSTSGFQDKFRLIIDNWLKNTREPVTTEEIYKQIEASISHLRKPVYKFLPEGIN